MATAHSQPPRNRPSPPVFISTGWWWETSIATVIRTLRRPISDRTTSRFSWGTATGAFTAAAGSPYAVGTAPYGLAGGNFSGHGGLDLVVTNAFSNTITFLFNSSTPGPIPPLQQKPTLTTLTSSPNPATFGEAVTFTATVTGAGGTPTGTVTFYDGTASLGTGTLNGSGVATLTTSALIVGVHPISATYGGTPTLQEAARPPCPA